MPTSETLQTSPVSKGDSFAYFHRHAVPLGYAIQKLAANCEQCGGCGTIWPQGLTARVCPSCNVLRRSIHRHHNLFDTLDLGTKSGARIVFAHLLNGYPHDITKAKRLVLGHEYTVERVTVYDSSSTVELVEVPGVKFNTVHFRNLSGDA